MLNDVKVKVGPQYYHYAEGAILEAPQFLKAHHASTVLVVHGSISWEKARPFLPFVEDSEEYRFIFWQYSGQCSYFSANKIQELVFAHQIDFIIGVGGGKLVDLVSYAANVASVPYGVIPTLASNCAPWTPLAVMYKENGQSEGITEHFVQQAAFFLADPRLILDSPIDYFLAGIADTLAKFYESDLLTSQSTVQDELFIGLARAQAILCKDILLSEGDQAILDMENQRCTAAFKRCSEVIFAIAGLVGGFGDKYARNAIAHSMHDAMGKYLKGASDYLHGEKVAYGIFYQLALEEKWATIEELIPYYDKMGFPKSLRQMGIFPQEEEVLDRMVELMYSQERVGLVPIDTSKPVLKEKILQLEIFILDKEQEG